jgi:carboxyl-terminal processing protease
LSSGEEEFGLKLTTAFYYTAANRLIHGKGIIPDIVIKEPDITIEEILAQRIIDKKGLLKNFLSKNRKPNEAQVKVFHAQLQQLNLPVSLRVLHRLIYNEQHRMDLPPVYDLKWDMQLQEALKIFAAKPQLFKRAVIARN